MLGQANQKINFQFQDDGAEIHLYKSFSYDSIPSHKLALASRLYVYPEYRGQGAFLPLFKGMFQWSAKEGIERMLFEIRNPLYAAFKEYGLSFKRISKFYNYYGIERAIYFTELQPFMDTLHDTHLEVWKFFTEDGCIYPYSPKIYLSQPFITRRLNAISQPKIKNLEPALEVQVLSRQQLEDQYEKILVKSGIVKEGLSFKYQGSSVNIVLQSTSGSRNAPLLIPRSVIDIQDIITRALNYYKAHWGSYPARVAMLGGISHINAAEAIDIEGVSIKHFSLDSLSELREWQPQMISCYPSILRVLLEKWEENLNFLKAIKVGGEKLFPADCKKVFFAYPNMLIIEQYGSTELPALAFRSIHKQNFNFSEAHIQIPFELQIQRFTFRDSFCTGWNAIIARDNFTQLLFKLDLYYDTGDEALWQSSKIIDFRRRLDKEYNYWDAINRLLLEGVTNIQLDLEKKVIFYEGQDPINKYYLINGMIFSLQKKLLSRIKSSNKLPFIISETFSQK